MILPKIVLNRSNSIISSSSSRPHEERSTPSAVTGRTRPKGNSKAEGCRVVCIPLHGVPYIQRSAWRLVYAQYCSSVLRVVCLCLASPLYCSQFCRSSYGVVFTCVASLLCIQFHRISNSSVCSPLHGAPLSYDQSRRSISCISLHGVNFTLKPIPLQ